MNRDQLTGLAFLLGSIIGIIVYATLLFFNVALILQITAFVAVAGILGIIGWVGYTLTTTPPQQQIGAPAKEMPEIEENEVEPCEGKSQKSHFILS